MGRPSWWRASSSISASTRCSRLLWWRAFEPGLGPRRAALVGFLISSGYAATDELHQTFVEDRNGNPVDWLIDTAGAGLMAILLRSGLPRRSAA